MTKYALPCCSTAYQSHILTHTPYAGRAAWQTSSADPSLPVGAAIAFSIYKVFDKRKKRAPEGDASARSHIWGAVAVTVFGLVLGSLVSQLPSYLTYPSGTALRPGVVTVAMHCSGRRPLRQLDMVHCQCLSR